MVAQRRTDNAMANKKMSKGQTIIYKKLHRKQKIEPHEPNYNMSEEKSFNGLFNMSIDKC